MAVPDPPDDWVPGPFPGHYQPPGGWNYYYCPSRSRQTGKQCQRRAGYGTNHPGYGWCKYHLGTSPIGIKMAHRLRYNEIVAKLGAPAPAAEPSAEMLMTVRHAKGMVEVLSSLIQLAASSEALGTFDEITMDASIVEALKGVFGPDHLGDLRRHPLVELYGEWVGKLNRYSAECLKVGLAERQVEFEQNRIAMLAKVFFATIDSPTAGLSFEARAKLRGEFGAQLRALDAREAPALEAAIVTASAEGTFEGRVVEPAVPD